MPITVIPPPNVPDPTQQLGQLYEMYSAMQLQPLKMQLAQGQLAEQATQQEKARLDMESTRQGMGIASAQEKSRVDAETRALATRAAITRSTLESIQRAGITLAPGELAMIESGGDPKNLIGPQGLAFQRLLIETDPMLQLEEKERKGRIAAAGASAMASAEAAKTQREAREAAKEERARLRSGQESLAAGTTLAAPPESNPAIVMSVHSALAQGVPWSQIPEPMQAHVSPGLRDDQEAKELQRKLVQQQLDEATLKSKMAKDTWERYLSGKASPEEARKQLNEYKSQIASLEAERSKMAIQRVDDISKGKVRMRETGASDKEIAAYEVGALQAASAANQEFLGTMKKIAAIYDPALETAADVSTKLFSPTTPTPPPGVSSPPPAAGTPLSDAAMLEVKSMSADRFVATLKDLMASGSPEAKKKAAVLLEARGVPSDASGVANWVTSMRGAKPPPFLGLPSIGDVEAEVRAGMNQGKTSSGPSFIDMMRYGQGDAQVVNDLLEIQRQIKEQAGGASYGVRSP